MASLNVLNEFARQECNVFFILKCRLGSSKVEENESLTWVHDQFAKSNEVGLWNLSLPDDRGRLVSCKKV